MNKDSYSVDNMRVNRLTLDTLSKLDDGELAAAFNLAIDQMSKSVCADFGLDKKRELTLKVTMAPGRKSGQVDVGVVIGAVKLPGFIEQVHAVTLNDRGECTFIDGGDRRDPEQRVIAFNTRELQA